jgi:hypothetical protein
MSLANRATISRLDGVAGASGNSASDWLTLCVESASSRLSSGIARS